MDQNFEDWIWIFSNLWPPACVVQRGWARALRKQFLSRLHAPRRLQIVNYNLTKICGRKAHRACWEIPFRFYTTACSNFQLIRSTYYTCSLFPQQPPHATALHNLDVQCRWGEGTTTSLRIIAAQLVHARPLMNVSYGPSSSFSWIAAGHYGQFRVLHTSIELARVERSSSAPIPKRRVNTDTDTIQLKSTMSTWYPVTNRPTVLLPIPILCMADCS